MDTLETKTSEFSPAELFAQLSRLLTLYLRRAEDTDALDKLAPKDALACAKTVMAMMADLQGGKPAAIDEHTEWPAMEIPPVGRGLRALPSSGRAIRETRPPKADKSLHCSYPTTNNQQPITLLEDAVAAVCHADEETQALEPWARLLTRIDELCVRIQQDLDGWRESSGAEEWDPGDNGEPPAESALSLPQGDGRSMRTPLEFAEPTGDYEASDNDDGNDEDFPARHNPRGP
jgi:hypothetical protein